MSSTSFSKDSWKNISINNAEYAISTQKENKVWKICLTNLVELWTEDLHTKTIIERCKILNPLLKVKALNLDEIMEEILTDIPNHSVEKSINSITLHKNIQGGIFKFKIELSRASDEEFFEMVTKSLCLSSMVLFQRYSILLELIKKKDEEIAEYKAEGAKLIRKNIETKRFTKELFNSKQVNKVSYLNAFQSVVGLYSAAEKLNFKKESTCSENLKSPLESGDVNIEADQNRNAPQSSEILIPTSETKSSAANESRENVKRKPEEKRMKVKKAKSTISVSFTKPVKKVKSRVSNFIS